MALIRSFRGNDQGATRERRLSAGVLALHRRLSAQAGRGWDFPHFSTCARPAL